VTHCEENKRVEIDSEPFLLSKARVARTKYTWPKLLFQKGQNLIPTVLIKGMGFKGCSPGPKQKGTPKLIIYAIHIVLKIK